MKIPKPVRLLGICTLVACCGCWRSGPDVHARRLFVDAGGHRLNMLVLGQAGPTVVLESGLGGGIGWEQVRAEIGRFATVVTYDRAGLGQSEPGPKPRTARQIASELHTALANAGLPPPYVLVGHSMGGPYVRVFAAEYSRETAGIVLVDPTQVNVQRSMLEIRSWFEGHCPQDWNAVAAYCDALPEHQTKLAWMRGLEAKRVEEFLETVPQPRREGLRAEWLAKLEDVANRPARGSSNPGAADEFEGATESFQQASAAPLPAHIPVVLLAATGGASPLELGDVLSPNLRDLGREVQRWHVDDYREWGRAHPGVRIVLAPQCGHVIQRDCPDLVIRAVREVVDAVQARR
jgi:pimeloyl-ACP methyl ester carboxylesterase